MKRHTMLRTLTDVATRPWRTPRLRAAGPGPSSAREYGKDQVAMRSPARHRNYIQFSLSPSNSKQQKSIKRVHRAIYARNLQIDGFCAVRIYWRICVFGANARPRTLGTLPDDASRLMRGVPTQRLVGLRPPPCVVPPRKPFGFRQRTETRKPPSWHTKAHEISRSNELL